MQNPSEFDNEEYTLHIDPFALGDDRDIIHKLAEEEHEAFSAWENLKESCASLSVSEAMKNRKITHYDNVEYSCFYRKVDAKRHDLQYELIDVIQASTNMLRYLGTSQNELDDLINEVHDSNERKGRYKED